MRRAILLVAATLLAALLPTTRAVAQTSIAFLNPTPLRATHVPELSSQDGISVDFVAWTQQAPAGALVEFEIRASATTPPTFNAATVDGVFVGAGTYEGSFVIPSDWADGQYDLRVGLFTADGQEELAADEQIVTVNNEDVPPPPPAETVQLTYPDNGGGVGFFTPPQGNPNVVVEAVASGGAEQIRVLYTKSSPGDAPTWIPCGSGATSEAGVARVRCTLTDGDSANSVTAIAVAANNTPPPAPADPSQDDGTDAHRVLPFAATPSRVVISPDSQTAAAGACQLFTATVFDQTSQPIAAAPVDVHASGPTDQLTFARDPSTPVTNNTDNFQEPDKAHPSYKRTLVCSDESQDEELRQGVHRAIGADDRVHIESVPNGGTDNNGEFVFALFSNDGGGTQITAWADSNDDDTQNLNEAAGAAVLGWGGDPPPLSRQVFLDPDGATATSGTCQAITAVAREGGGPLAGANVDVHIQGPDSGVMFCTPPGATALRPPDSGGHVGDVHTAGEPRHGEGETDSSGRLVFGVVSASDGRTEIVVWLDESDDDTPQPGEPAAPGSITFQPQGERSVSLNASKSRVRSGGRVRFTGEIEGVDACAAGQTVRLKMKMRSGRRFRTVASKQTDQNGDFAFRRRITRTAVYRAALPRDGVCEPARSRNVRVRAT